MDIFCGLAAHALITLENCRNWHLERAEESEAEHSWTEAMRHRKIAASLQCQIEALPQLGGE
jgi:hypothetical protein